MTNDRLIEILRLVITKLEQDSIVTLDSLSSAGICGHISNLWHREIITSEERQYVKAFLYLNKPSDKQFTKYTLHKFWKDGIFWWLPISQERATAPIRVNYLKDLIKSVNG
jgi:hypothetical protein